MALKLKSIEVDLSDQMLYMKEGGYVMVFRLAGDETNLCYFSLASALDLNYVHQFGKPASDTETIHTANLVIDIKLFEQNVEQMLRHQEQKISA